MIITYHMRVVKERFNASEVIACLRCKLKLFTSKAVSVSYNVIKKFLRMLAPIQHEDTKPMLVLRYTALQDT